MCMTTSQDFSEAPCRAECDIRDQDILRQAVESEFSRGHQSGVSPHGHRCPVHALITSGIRLVNKLTACIRVVEHAGCVEWRTSNSMSGVFKILPQSTQQRVDDDPL